MSHLKIGSLFLGMPRCLWFCRETKRRTTIWGEQASKQASKQAGRQAARQAGRQTGRQETGLFDPWAGKFAAGAGKPFFPLLASVLLDSHLAACLRAPSKGGASISRPSTNSVARVNELVAPQSSSQTQRDSTSPPKQQPAPLVVRPPSPQTTTPPLIERVCPNN